MKLLIVNYHYIRNKKSGRGIFPITPSELNDQIDMLSKKYTFLSQDDLISIISKGHCPSGNFCLLTFDDGLKEQLIAYRILKERGLSGIFFISTMPVQDHRACSVHKLHYIMEQTNHQDLRKHLIETFSSFRSLSNDSNFQQEATNKYVFDLAPQALNKYFLNYVLSPHEKVSFIDVMFKHFVGNEEDFAKNLYMNRSEIAEIGAMGMLGSHGHSHEPLGYMPTSDVREELKYSKDILERISGTAIQSVSYPYGDPKAASQEVKATAKDYFKIGITTENGVNSGSDVVDNSHSLKRVSTSAVSKK